MMGGAVDVISANSERAYRADQRRFASWCYRNRRDAENATPGDVIKYLQVKASDGYSRLSIYRIRAAIRRMYLDRGKEPPSQSVRVQAAVRALCGTMPKRKVHKATILPKDISRMKATCDESLPGIRDLLVLTLLYDCQMMRHRISALDTEDVPKLPAAVQRLAFQWIKEAGISGGPLLRHFRKGRLVQDGRLSGGSVNAIVKRKAVAIGLASTLISTRSMKRP
jgi:site-specific recombinase XerD